MSIVIGLVILEIAYLLAVGPWRHRWRALDGIGPPAPVGRRQQASFLAGVLLLGLALASPIDSLAEALQSVHMLQHLLITLVVPPLLLIGLPDWLLGWLLRRPVVWPIARVVTRARFAFAIGNLTLLLWHLPAFYDLTLRFLPLHIFEHLTFIASALIMWWPILGKLPDLPRLSSPAQMLYIFLETLPCALLGIILGMAPVVLYPSYLTAPRLWGLTPLYDQQIAGLIMWIGTNLFWLGVLTAVFFAWAAREEDDLASELRRGQVRPVR